VNALRLRVRVVAIALALLGIAGGAHAQGLYWIDTNFAAPTLNRSDPNGFGVVTVSLGAGTLPEGLAVEANGRSYFGESAWSGARVQRVGLGLAGIAPIVTGGSALRGIAVDDVAQLIYWTTSNLVTGAAIVRSDIDGHGVTPLIALPAGANPRGIAVDHAGGKLYWADFDHDAIWRANLDGTQAAGWVVLPPGSGPWGVAVDPGHQQVFWTDYDTGLIERITTGGLGRGTIETGLANPTYLAIDIAGQRLYWAEGAAGGQHLARAATIGGAPTPLPPPLATYGGVGFSAGTLVTTPDALPTTLALGVWPTPARGVVHLSLALPRDVDVRLRVLDLQGRVVATLADGPLAPGRIERDWTPGPGVAPGLYFVRMDTDAGRWTRRIVLSR